MYANDTKTGFIKVYPNKDAVKQMVLQNVRSNSCYENHIHPVIHSEKPCSQQHIKPKSNEDCGDFYILLLILILLCGDEGNGEALFTLILGSLFLD